jgi:hypothetical protein
MVNVVPSCGRCGRMVPEGGRMLGTLIYCAECIAPASSDDRARRTERHAEPEQVHLRREEQKSRGT